MDDCYILVSNSIMLHKNPFWYSLLRIASSLWIFYFYFFEGLCFKFHLLDFLLNLSLKQISFMN